MKPLLSYLAIAATSLGLASCDEIPSDPLETTQEVEETGMLKVGFVSGEPDAEYAEMERFASLVAEAHGARIEPRAGSEGALFRALESEKLDLVVGVFPKASPWRRRVAFTSPIDRTDPESETPVLRGAVHLGENRWLLSIERTIEGTG